MPKQPVIRAFFDEPTNTVSYLVADPVTRQAAVIDPVLDYDHRSDDRHALGRDDAEGGEGGRLDGRLGIGDPRACRPPPASRAARAVGRIIAAPHLGGLHHQYVRI